MVVQVQAPQRQKRDIFDVLSLGLQAAKFYTDTSKAEREFELREKALGVQATKEAEAQKVATLKAGTEQENKLRNEWLKNPQTKTAQEVSASVGKVRESAKDPSAAGDIALIFNYMKLLDPGSVVREGEFATAQNAAGVPDRVRNFYNQLATGERLNPAQRSDFTNRAEQLYNVHVQRQQAFNKEFEDLAKRQGLNPANVVLKKVIQEIAPIRRSGLTAPSPGLNEDIDVLNQNMDRRFEKDQKELGPLPEDPIERGREHLRRLRGE